MEKSRKVKQRRLLRRKYGNREYRKRIKLMHRRFTRSEKFMRRQEPYRSMNLSYARVGASLAGMARTEQVFYTEMCRLCKQPAKSTAAGKEEQQ